MSAVKLESSGDSLLLRYDAGARRPLSAILGGVVIGFVGLLLLQRGMAKGGAVDAVLGLVVAAGGGAMVYLVLFAKRLQTIETRFEPRTRALTIIRRFASSAQTRTIGFDEVAALLCLHSERPKRGPRTTIAVSLVSGGELILAPLAQGAPDRIAAMVEAIASATGLSHPFGKESAAQRLTGG